MPYKLKGVHSLTQSILQNKQNLGMPFITNVINLIDYGL